MTGTDFTSGQNPKTPKPQNPTPWINYYIQIEINNCFYYKFSNNCISYIWIIKSINIWTSLRLLSRLGNSFKNIEALLAAHQTGILLGTWLQWSRLHWQSLIFIYKIIILLFYLFLIEIKRILKCCWSVPVILFYARAWHIFVIYIIKAKIIICFIICKIKLKSIMLIIFYKV